MFSFLLPVEKSISEQTDTALTLLLLLSAVVIVTIALFSPSKLLKATALVYILFP